MNGPVVGDGQGKHRLDRGRLDHRAEGLIVVDVGSLGEAIKDLASLVPFLRAIGVELVLEDPFLSDHVRANEARKKITGVVGNQGSKFFFHGATPVRIDEGGTDGGGCW
jgi:hypothetical protein